MCHICEEKVILCQGFPKYGSRKIFNNGKNQNHLRQIVKTLYMKMIRIAINVKAVINSNRK